MKLIISIFLVICVFASVFGDGCNYGGVNLKVGETYSKIGTCVQITCQNNGYVTGKTCPAFPPVARCEQIPQNNSKPYPKCCPSQKCPEP